ncbi:MAG: sensor histidine kinase [Balneola sp.]|nr:MAG: sensor histidine kinase [Balneola sp.]
MIGRFRIGVILRVLFLFVMMGVFSVLIFSTEYYISSSLIGLIVIFQVFNLVRFVETTNKQLHRFFEAISYNDFSQTFTNQEKNNSFAQLNDAFNTIIEKFKNERAKGEESFRYLQTVVQHIGIGLFSYNQKGEIELFNTAAKRLLDTSIFRNIEQLRTINEGLYNTITGLKSGSRTLQNCKIGADKLQLAIYATEFRMKGDNYKLISLQNISSELDEKEMEAWQNLTQVLAHEIMNSITPIASLSDTVNSMLMGDVFGSEDPEPIPPETLRDVKDALGTINKRSLGLMRFVNSYRNITQIPTPIFEVLLVKDILNRVRNLMKGEAAKRRVTVEIEVEPETLEITADSQLIDQALINIVKNAFKALSERSNPKIILRGKIDSSGKIVIEIEDNGPGIKDSVKEKIFVPFYTTSKSNTENGGSGIGLSLSRQIMRMHRGTLNVTESREGCTIFSLRF